MRTLYNNRAQRSAFIPSIAGTNSKLALFVHGFGGGYVKTWGSLSDMLKRNADSDRVLRDWDFLFVGYNTWDVVTYLDIATLVLSHWKLALAGQLPQPSRAYERLALFGHSLGTLGLRQILCAWSEQPTDLKDQLVSITLFGTPLNGSGIARALAWLPGTPRILSALEPNNPQLRMLKTWSDGAYPAKPWPKVRLILGQGDKVVGSTYAELVKWLGDAAVEVGPLDHSALVKPDSWATSNVLQYIRWGLQ